VLVDREAAEDVVIAGVPIPKGTTIHICPQVIHSHRGVWGTDASVFDPDRWDRLTRDQASPYASEAFINGPRVCIGRAFAMLEYKTLLIGLVRKWRFSRLDQEQDLEVLNPSVTLKPKGGLKIVMEKVE
jgi:cytochrome P450